MEPGTSLRLSHTTTSFYPDHTSCDQVLRLLHFVHISHEDTEAQRYKLPEFLCRRNAGYILASSGSGASLWALCPNSHKDRQRHPARPLDHPAGASLTDGMVGLVDGKRDSGKSNCNSKLKLQLHLSCRLELLGIS